MHSLLIAVKVLHIKKAIRFKSWLISAAKIDNYFAAWQTAYQILHRCKLKLKTSIKRRICNLSKLFLVLNTRIL